jgi:hypothetical protein
LLVPPKPPVPRDEPDIPELEEPEDPDMPEPDDPDEPDSPEEPDDFGEPEEPDDPDDPDEPEKPDEPLLDEPDDALRLLCPLMPERFVSPANSSEADGERFPLGAFRELLWPADWSPRMSRCDDEPDWPDWPDWLGRLDEPDCWSLCDPDRPDDPLMPP